MTTNRADDRPRIRYKRQWDRATQDRKKLAARRAARQPLVYFLRCRSFVKIGWTTDPAHRLVSIQSCNPDVVLLAALMRGGEREEAALHRAFQPLYHRAEWFREEGTLAELIGLIQDKQPTDARIEAGDWFLEKFGKTTLLFNEETAQKLDQGLRISNETP